MNQHNVDSRDLRPLAWTIYATALLMVVVPLLELVARLGFSMAPGALNWRTGAVGLASSAVITPTFGVTVALVGAYLFGHRVMQRAVGVIAGLTALALGAVIVVFALDALQMRSYMAEEMQRSFLLASIKAIVNFGLSGLVLVLTSIAGLRGGWSRKASAQEAAKRAGMGEMPLVGAAR